MIFGKRYNFSGSPGSLTISIQGYNVFYYYPSAIGDSVVSFTGMSVGQVLFIINDSIFNGKLTVTPIQTSDGSILANTSRIYIYNLSPYTSLYMWCGSR